MFLGREPRVEFISNHIFNRTKGILEHLNLSTYDNQGLNNGELNDSTRMQRNRIQEPVS